MEVQVTTGNEFDWLIRSLTFRGRKTAIKAFVSGFSFRPRSFLSPYPLEKPDTQANLERTDRKCIASIPAGLSLAYSEHESYLEDTNVRCATRVEKLDRDNHGSTLGERLAWLSRSVRLVTENNSPDVTVSLLRMNQDEQNHKNRHE